VPQYVEHRRDGLARNLALAEALGPIAARHGVTVAAVAVAWALAFPGVTGAIVGVRRAGQLDAWLPAASLALDDTDLTRIAEAVVCTGAGSDPAVPGHAV
jgi:aryl-alcohol dehydrogenase-like predicted oxidoreductase